MPLSPSELRARDIANALDAAASVDLRQKTIAQLEAYVASVLEKYRDNPFFQAELAKLQAVKPDDAK